MKIIAVRRDDCFSPNSVEKDRLILEVACQKICAQLEREGFACGLRWVDEADLTKDDEADLYLSMARLPEALQLLGEFEQQGRRVINSAQGVMNCQRSKLNRLMRDNHIPMPSNEPGDGPSWLKRGDAAAQSKDDVVFCRDAEALKAAIEQFRQRGISEYVVSTHVEGDVVKFYGVLSPEGNDTETFFRLYYPTDDGETKFDDEAQHNGVAHHYDFDQKELQQEVTRLARLLQVDVYGGDAIVDKDGRFYIIDFNDWPSFSRCREEAAEAVASLC
ncbi:MAG: hypothetical protein K6C10_09540 [Prevotella sp.]|nr:hypothetical protein [Prevotella sp.]